MTYFIRRLFIYPIKSLGGIELMSSPITSRGLQFDRRFMLIDDSEEFITQRTSPKMALMKTAIDGGNITVSIGENVFRIPLEPVGESEIDVRIWSDNCLARTVSKDADQFFSDHLSRACRLVYMPDSSRRMVNEKYRLESDITSFTDGFPILLIGTASLDDLNRRLAEKNSDEFDWDRFRPSVVVETSVPFEEDYWSSFSMGEYSFAGVKKCSRCVITTIDQYTALAGKEPLKTLASYRSENNNVNFGMNVLTLQSQGMLSVGDEVTVTKTISAES